MPTSASMSPTDQALLTAVAAWGGDDAGRLLARFGSDAARRLDDVSPGHAIAALKSARDAQLGHDPARVHWSWYARALQEETESVRKTVVQASVDPLRSILLRELRLDPLSLASDGSPDSDARAVALTLWTERLVGDVPRRLDDPPAIVALATISPRGVYRLMRDCGLLKRSLLAESHRPPDRPAYSGRLKAMSLSIEGRDDARLLTLAANDWMAVQSLARHRLAALGLSTLGRLLSTADPYRVRWALQHVPYGVAKRLRVAASQPPASVRAVLAWEGHLLEVVMSRLREAGGLAVEPEPERSQSA